MRHFKHYCKLIISTIAVVLVFACNSLVSYADPITGAMTAAMFADGILPAGMAGLVSSSTSGILGDFYTDIIPWDQLIIAGKAYITIRNLVGSNNVEVELSPELSTAGYNRTQQFVSHYNVAPGTIHNFGTYSAFRGYAFTKSEYSSSLGYIYKGATLGYSPYFDSSYTQQTVDSTVFLYSDTFLNFNSPSGSNRLNFTPTIMGQNPTPSYVTYLARTPICLTYSPSANWLRFFASNSQTYFGGQLYITSSDISSYSPSVDRDSDSEIVNPNGQVNSVVVPASLLQDVAYTPDVPVTSEQLLEEILDILTEAYTNSDVVDSSYQSEPAPTPTGDTISETAYSVLNDTFDEFKEFFGDIYDGITGFQESFGDWVDDVASGWTEVFGDIYSDLHGFKESFGDWVDDVASGWTEIFGDIYSTLSGTIADSLSTISSAVQSLIQSIENADFEFIDAFWKNFFTPFNSLFNTIKTHLSIWHYVVEWLASISSVFTFYLGVFTGAGSGFLLPIYACFAGTVVIAVYKRFGK